MEAYNYLQTRRSLRNVIKQLQTRCFGIAGADSGKEAFMTSSIWKSAGRSKKGTERVSQVTLVTQAQEAHKQRKRPVDSEAAAPGGHQGAQDGETGSARLCGRH